MEYKRLTSDLVTTLKYKDMDELKDKFVQCAVRLMKLEDRIENGTLTELPCSIGDTVYYINYKYKIIENVVTAVYYSINKKKEIVGRLTLSRTERDEIFNQILTSSVYWKDYNKTWFTDIHEAKKKLKKLKEEVK